MSFTPPTIHAAWRNMYMERGCPPISVLRRGGENVQHHLRSCEECRIWLDAGDDFSRAAAEHINNAKKRSPVTPPRPGEVRQVRIPVDPMSFFDKYSRYQSPPLVMVLGKEENGIVRVAQVFEEPALALADDVSLTDERHAEAWNIYALPPEHLGDAQDAYGEEAATDVLLAAKTPAFPPRETHTVTIFRQREMEVAAFIVEKSREVMSKNEGKGTPDTLQTRILRAQKSLHPEEDTSGLARASVHFQGQYAAAAAGKEMTVLLPEINEDCRAEVEGDEVSFFCSYIPKGRTLMAALYDTCTDEPIRLNHMGKATYFITLRSDFKVFCRLDAANLDPANLRLAVYLETE